MRVSETYGDVSMEVQGRTGRIMHLIYYALSLLLHFLIIRSGFLLFLGCSTSRNVGFYPSKISGPTHRW